VRSRSEVRSAFRRPGPQQRPAYPPRYADEPGKKAVTGYAVAARDGRQARSRKTGITGAIWFGGGKLASDLTLPALRRRWQADGTTGEALAAWSAVITLDDLPAPANHIQARGQVQLDPAAAADLLAAAASACEPGAPGPLSQAARHMARAAQQPGPAPRRPQVMAVISDMASTFLAITAAGTGDVLTLVREVAELIDTVASTREATKAKALVSASLTTLAQAADQQATTVLHATVPATRKENTMSELTHEEEFLAQLTAAGTLAARLARANAGQQPGEPADVKTLRAAGYTETTPFDDHLRHELGEQRWAWYTADPARLVCAAAITDAARAGYDVPALLTRVCQRRAWENDQQSPARSIARVLYYRINREMTRAPRPPKTDLIRTNSGDTPTSHAPARAPMPRTPWDDLLKNLLGEQRWNQYATDDRRRDVAARLTQAAADSHDVGALLTQAVNCREWEDDLTSPSRRVGSVLHYRVSGLIASGEFRTTSKEGQLPSQVAQAVGRSTAPANDPHPARADTTPRPRAAQSPQPGHSRD
jgi:hypothetical protein